MRQVLVWIPIKTAWFPNGIPIYGYGLMLFFAFVVCTWLAGRRAEKEGIAKERIQDLALWLFIGGLLGSRIVFLLSLPPASRPYHDLVSFLKQLPQIWDGGVVFYGGAIGGVIGYLLAYAFILRKEGISTLQLADIVAPSIAVGLCLGRIGCFLNGCCHGGVACADCPVYAVHFPLAAPVRYDLVRDGYQTAAGFTMAASDPGQDARVARVEPESPAYRGGLRSGDLIVKANDCEINSYGDLTRCLATPDAGGCGKSSGWPRGEAELTLTVLRDDPTEPVQLSAFAPRTLGVQPTQLYESISMALLFWLLTAYYPHRRREGQVMALLMIGYGLHRSLNELLRADAQRPVAFEIGTSIFLIAAGLALFVWLQLRPTPYQKA